MDASATPVRRPFVLATFFDGGPEEGGGYTQKRRMLHVLRRLQNDELSVIVICSGDAGMQAAREEGLTAVRYPRSWLRKAVCRALAQKFLRRLFGRTIGSLHFTLDARLRELGTDLVLFTGPDGRALELLRHNFVFSVWDLCHLDHPEFAEVAHDGEFERREYLYSSVLPRAVAVLVDSEHGRKVVSEHYGVTLARVFAAPFLTYEVYRNFVPDPAQLRRVIERYKLRQPYVFYPAQFWPHKNHKYILEAVSLLVRAGRPAPHIVFSGSDKGGLAAVMRRARELGVADRVIQCGFVPDEDMPYLYHGSLALVMPTYFGPTNIPPQEALALGVPVCYSDFPSFREQLGANAHYMDLQRPQALAEILEQLQAQAPATAPGTQRGSAPAAMAEDVYVRVLQEIISGYAIKLFGAVARERA